MKINQLYRVDSPQKFSKWLIKYIAGKIAKYYLFKF
jgi:hypothetical protein